MLYLSDNLAYIPYTVVDEPLFVIHQIDIMVSVSGSNLLQSFKEVNILMLKKKPFFSAQQFKKLSQTILFNLKKVWYWLKFLDT